MQKLTASGIPCNGIYREPEDRRDFVANVPALTATDSRHGICSSQYVIRSSPSWAKAKANPTNPCLIPASCDPQMW